MSSRAARHLLIAPRACMRTSISKCHRRPPGWIDFSTQAVWVQTSESR